MFGIFNRIFLMVLGYVYPAYECYKTLENNTGEIEELRFWCQYWITVAILSVLERVADVFISWLPLYGELKLGLFVYLWYPKVKGSAHVYGNILKPYMSKHETEIDRKLNEARERACDYFFFYWSNWAKLAQSTFFQLLHYIAGQSSPMEKGKESEIDTETTSNGLTFLKQSREVSVGKIWPPTPLSSSPGRLHQPGSLVLTRSKLSPKD